MMKARRSIRLVSALAAVAMVSAACTSDSGSSDDSDTPSADEQPDDQGSSVVDDGDDAGSAGGPSSVALWRFFNECSTEYAGVTELADTTDVCAVQQVLANAFNAENDLQVETTSLVWPGIVELNSSLSAGAAPDIFSLHAFRIPSYASLGALTPLTAYFEEAGIDVDDMLPGVRDSVTFNGEIYALPFDIHGILWHINLELWDEAGLLDGAGNPMIPTGLAQFEDACQNVLDATGGPIIGSAEDDIVGTAWIWYQLLAQDGGSAVDADGMPLVNSDQAIEALNTHLRLREQGCIGSGELGRTYEQFVGGEIASVVGGTWMVNEWTALESDASSALHDNYYVASMPQLGPEPATQGGSHTFVVPLGANADPDRVRAAVQYLKFFWDNELEWTRTGHGTVRASTTENPDYLSLPHRQEYLDFGENLAANPSTTWAVGFDQIMHEEVQAALLGQKTPEEALNSAQARLVDVASFG